MCHCLQSISLALLLLSSLYYLFLTAIWSSSSALCSVLILSPVANFSPPVCHPPCSRWFGSASGHYSSTAGPPRWSRTEKNSPRWWLQRKRNSCLQIQIFHNSNIYMVVSKRSISYSCIKMNEGWSPQVNRLMRIWTNPVTIMGGCK